MKFSGLDSLLLVAVIHLLLLPTICLFRLVQCDADHFNSAFKIMEEFSGYPVGEPDALLSLSVGNDDLLKQVIRSSKRNYDGNGDGDLSRRFFFLFLVFSCFGEMGLEKVGFLMGFRGL